MDVWGWAGGLSDTIRLAERSVAAWIGGQSSATFTLGIERATSWSSETAGRMHRWMAARAVRWGHAMRGAMWWAAGRAPAWFWTTAQVCLRLLAALGLGALAGPYADLGLRVPADIAFRLSVAVLLLPVLAVVLLLTVPRRRWVAALAGALLLVIAADAVGRFLAAGPQAQWLSLLVVAQWLVLLLVPVAAGFVLGGPGPNRRTIGVAGGAGLAAWAGVGLHHLLLAAHAGAYSDRGPAGMLGTPLLIFLLLLFVVEIPAAAFGGLLGGAVRVRLAPMPRRVAGEAGVASSGAMASTEPADAAEDPAVEEPATVAPTGEVAPAGEAAPIVPLPTVLPATAPPEVAREPVAQDIAPQDDGGDDAPTPLIA